MDKLTSSNIDKYFKSRGQVNWNRINLSVDRGCSKSFPFISKLLGSQEISMSECYCDGTKFQLGDTPYFKVCSCSQKINEDLILTDISDQSSLTISNAIKYLNRLSIKYPFPVDEIGKLIDMKMFTQRISSKSSFSDSIYRYLEKIEIIPFFEDTLRPNKVFNLEKISNIMNQNFGSLNFHDLTDYDLSNIYYHTNNILVSYDISNHCFISSSVGDLTSFINDFTNMFTDYSTSLLYDYTYIDYSVHSGDLTSNIIVITKDQSFVISSPMEQNFVIFSENICNDVTGFVTSQIVPYRVQTLMCDSICKILKTEKTGQNEFIDLSISISYGDYIYNILKFYYCFPDSLIILVMKLVMAWILRGSNDDLLVSEVNELLSMIFGTNRTTGQTAQIKTLETSIKTILLDMTGISAPVIYNDGTMDYTTNVSMLYTQTVDDIYTMISEFNRVQFLYVFDFGYDGLMRMEALPAFQSFNRLYFESGYLSVFLTTNEIEF